MIKLTIEVSNIDVIISLYNQIRVYTSDSESGTYTYITSITLLAGVSTYYYTHVTGDSDTWYRSSYYNTTTESESSFSNAVRGEEPTLYQDATYPEEYSFDADEELVIRRIRRYIGDFKQLGRLYSDGSEACSSVMDDNSTIDVGEKSWPVYVSINSSEYTTIEDPVVQGYRYLTFSGSITSSDVIDVWYYTFKFSDRQIYEAYGDAMLPPNVPSAVVSQDHLVLQSAIDLLENMTAEDLVDSGAMIRDDQTVYDPSYGFRERGSLIGRLQKQLDALISESVRSSMLGLTGVLID